MQAITTIGLDIAKSVFQVHGVDEEGNVVFRRQLKRRYVLSFFQKLPPCLVGIEACATSHYWSRELQALGHKVRLMPPAYVKPYVKRPTALVWFLSSPHPRHTMLGHSGRPNYCCAGLTNRRPTCSSPPATRLLLRELTLYLTKFSSLLFGHSLGSGSC